MTVSEISFDNVAFAEAINGSIAENARKLGITRGYLNNILKGRRKPSADLLLKIQATYKLSAKTISKKTF